MWIFSLGILILFGLTVGSFLNVCVYRLPRNESVLLTRSYCPECGRTIKWYDNVPLVGYLLLGGRCRYCNSSISLSYPMGEMVSALVFAGAGYYWLLIRGGEWLNFLVVTTFVLVCFTIARVDFAETIIPNEINYSFIMMGILLAPISHYPLTYGPPGHYAPDQVVTVAGGVFLGGGLFLVLAVLSPLFYGRPALGMGDVKLMAGMGAWLGTKLMLFTMIFGSILGALIGTSLLLFQGKSLRTEIPFGPFLCVAGVLAMLVGEPLVTWYLSLL